MSQIHCEKTYISKKNHYNIHKIKQVKNTLRKIQKKLVCLKFIIVFLHPHLKRVLNDFDV